MNQKTSNSSKKSVQNKEDCYLTGQLLIAMPLMQDPRFHEAVILICSHDEQGAMGLIINKPLDSVNIYELLKQLDLEFSQKLSKESPIYFGGPVEIGRGFVLHSSEYTHKSSIKVTEDISLSSTSHVIQDALDGKGPENFLLALGYAGWGAGQLENEIKANGWITAKASLGIVFSKDRIHLWEHVLKINGINPDAMILGCGHA